MAASSSSSTPLAAAAVVFAVNGERVELRDGDVDPGATLLEFLRTRTRFTGPKLGCGEGTRHQLLLLLPLLGGCGACVVLLSTYDAATGAVSQAAASSCLTLVHGLHHRAVTTTEGLKSRGGGLHAVHERLAGFHASQCGFCTPGVCMSLAAALAGAEKDGTRRPGPREGFSRLTAAEAERAVAGNLCRCTGYRPIADACKSFAADVDLEDLGLNSFWRKGEASVSKLSRYNEGSIGAFPEFIKAEIRASLGIDCSTPAALVRNGSNWYRPRSVEEYYKLVGSELFSQSKIKVVVGNTASGVYREAEVYDSYIELKGVPELNSVKKDAKGVEIGAAVSISQAIEILREGDSFKDVVFSKIADHLEKVASGFVRNTASMGGNLIMAQRDQFASDIATILLAAGSSIRIQVSSERLTVTLEEFLEMPPCDHKTLLLSIWIPRRTPTGILSSDRTTEGSASTSGTSLLFETYRAGPRPLGNAVAYLNAAFLARVTSDETSGSLILEDLCLAFGAHGTHHAIRARNVEKIFVGKPVTASALHEACKVLKKTVVPNEGTRHAVYRSSLAVAFLFSFLYPLIKGTLKLVKPIHLNGCITSGVNGNANQPVTHVDASLKEVNNVKSGLCSNVCILESSKQIIVINKDYLPVGIPAKKVGAELQASGEAVFVDDIPSPKDCLYGAFIYSTKPLAHVKSIELDSSLKQLKNTTVVTVNDIPEGGGNFGASTVFGLEPLFGDPLTQCAGEPLGVVIAETQRLANIAAKRAVISYSTENLDTPILSIEDAVRRCSYFETPPFLLPQKIGDFSKGMAKADQKICSAEVKLNSQYFFYMETQTALAIPDEDNCMVVYSSSQCPETAQNVIAKCLGLPCHNVRVITRRVGGGFGGKAVRSLPVCNARSWRSARNLHTVESLALFHSECAEDNAQMTGVDLSAREYYVPGPSGTYLNYGAAASEVEIDLLTGTTTVLRSDLIYDCGQSLNPAVDLGQVEGAFVQGIGYFMNEEYVTNPDGLVVSDGTWTYKIPTLDTIPKQFNIELLNSGFHKKRVLSSKASGEPPLLLAASVHCATREAIRAARKEIHCSGSGSSPSHFDLEVPAIMPVVKELCGLDNVERYLEGLMSSK
ncbi:hypothetical protein PR202_gb12364 [Eleusine coracana subsp. coracana]|uniref:FAD-binding PCMH-type domain-containing protein n=1 Tax=Eleusine coracana subsp. coracana TaxID=191504 RepID=A0AAV5EPU4_ELECO|nr:hypothetical protein PR202_gb12364 [Eleusine coracana subsp. coracana]